MYFFAIRLTCRGDDFTEFQFVQNRGFASSIKPNHDDFSGLLRPTADDFLDKVSHVVFVFVSESVLELCFRHAR
jgi:hypothetical protein